MYFKTPAQYKNVQSQHSPTRDYLYYSRTSKKEFKRTKKVNRSAAEYLKYLNVL